MRVIVTWSGWAFGIIGVVATIITAYLSLRKRRISLTSTSSAIIRSPDDSLGLDIEVRVNDQKVANPVLMKIEMQNLGPKDLPSSQFDQNKPLTLDINMPVLSIVASIGFEHLPMISPDNANHIEIQPELLRKGKTWTLTALVDAVDNVRATPVPMNNLVDTRFVPNNNTMVGRVFFYTGMTESILILLLGLFFPQWFPNSHGQPSRVAPTIFGGILLALSFTMFIPWVRTKAAWLLSIPRVS